jgi:iron complex transport system substrate-binding protein
MTAAEWLLIDKAPQRIISLLPSLGEIVCELQACERLVGVDRYSNWPERVKSLPQIGWH